MVFSNSKYITVTLITVGHIFVYLVSLDVLPGLIQVQLRKIVTCWWNFIFVVVLHVHLRLVNLLRSKL